MKLRCITKQGGNLFNIGEDKDHLNNGSRFVSREIVGIVMKNNMCVFDVYRILERTLFDNSENVKVPFKQWIKRLVKIFIKENV